METRYGNEFVAYNCRYSRADLLALQKAPEIAELIARGSVEALRSGLEGFCRECHIAMLDFTEEARKTAHKFRILHGSDDAIVEPVQSIAFAEAVPGTEVELVEGVGQLLFYSHWRSVFEAVRGGFRPACRSSLGQPPARQPPAWPIQASRSR